MNNFRTKDLFDICWGVLVLNGPLTSLTYSNCTNTVKKITFVDRTYFQGEPTFRIASYSVSEVYEFHLFHFVRRHADSTPRNMFFGFEQLEVVLWSELSEDRNVLLQLGARAARRRDGRVSSM